MGTLVFIFVISVLIIVHEFGHFITAKKLGVHVERFAIGFGPKLFQRVIKGTEFAVCLIPLGGYVKMAGDERQACQGKDNEFYAKPIGKRALIVLAGPVVNYVFAFFCFFLVFLVGYPTLSTTIGELRDNYPAQIAGLQAGDKILQIDDQKTESWEEIQSYISRSERKSLVVVFSRQNVQKTMIVEPIEKETENIFGQKIQSRFVGIVPAEEIIFLRYGPLESLTRSMTKLGRVTGMTYKALYLMVTGGMSAKDAVTGPVGIFYLVRQAASLGFSYVLYILAMISASLAIFNLLPFPVLDGGHLFLFALEKVRGKPLPTKVDDVIHRISLGLIIFLALFVFYSDFIRFGIFEKIFNFFSQLFSS